MSRKWDVAQLKSRANGISRRWDVTQMGCCAYGMSRSWKVAQLGSRTDGIGYRAVEMSRDCRADGISRNWNVAHLKSRANGMSRRWDIAQKMSRKWCEPTRTARRFHWPLLKASLTQSHDNVLIINQWIDVRKLLFRINTIALFFSFFSAPTSKSSPLSDIASARSLEHIVLNIQRSP